MPSSGAAGMQDNASTPGVQEASGGCSALGPAPHYARSALLRPSSSWTCSSRMGGGPRLFRMPFGMVEEECSRLEKPWHGSALRRPGSRRLCRYRRPPLSGLQMIPAMGASAARQTHRIAFVHGCLRRPNYRRPRATTAAARQCAQDRGVSWGQLFHKCRELARANRTPPRGPPMATGQGAG